eukprot:7436227-Heterocapsa_arctica.AAC.1
MIVTNQQNASNLVFRDNMLKVGDDPSDFIDSFQVLMANTAWDESMTQSRFILQPDDKAKITKFSEARVAVVTMGMVTICRSGHG